MSIDDVTDIEPRRQYVAAAAQDEFDYPFPIFAEGDLVVDVDGVIRADYTVAGVGDDTGGTITFDDPLDGGEIVTIWRETTIERTTDFQNNGPFTPARINDELDRLTIIAQELKAGIRRSLRFPQNSTQGDAEFSPIDSWLERFPYINADGELEPAAAVALTTLTQSIIAALLYPRSEAEILAGITPSDYAYLSAEALGGMFRYGAVGDWNGSTGTDDSSAFRRLSLVVQARGGGVVDLGSRRYRVFSDSSTDPLLDLSDLRGVTIKSDGAEIVIDRTFTGSQIVQPFLFTDCVGVKLVGNLKFTCTQTQAATERADRGAECMVFMDGCENIDLDAVESTSNRFAVEFRRNSTSDPKAKRIRIGLIKATTTGYGLACVLSGDQLQAYLETDGCVRSYYPYGIDNHNVHVRSKNFKGNADCYLATAQGQGSTNITLLYENIATTDADNSVCPIRLSFTDETPAAHIGHRIRTRVSTGSTPYTGFVVLVEKLDDDETPSVLDKGHVLRDIQFELFIDGDNANQRTIGSSGTWGSGEFVTDISFRNCIFDAAGQPQFSFLRSLVGVAHFDRCVFTVVPDIPTPVGAGSFKFSACSAPGFTTSTADARFDNYDYCRITDMSNQSVINKSFHDCRLPATSFTGTLTGCTTSPTGTIEFTINGDMVTLKSPNIQGTSNATTATVTGMPAYLRPAAAQLLLARIQDNTVDAIALVRIETSGVITMFKDVTAGTAFTGSGTKGFSSQTLPPYRLR